MASSSHQLVTVNPGGDMADVQVNTPPPERSSSSAAWVVVVVLLLAALAWFVFGRGTTDRNVTIDANINTPGEATGGGGTGGGTGGGGTGGGGTPAPQP
jgi:hypothetical protein